MKTTLGNLLWAGFLLMECSTNEVVTDTSACVQALIAQIRSQPVWNPPARVYRYKYRGQTVYSVSSRCCDVASALYDENCRMLCAPDGGISGAGDGKCPDFANTRTDEVLVWRDTRN